MQDPSRQTAFAPHGEGLQASWGTDGAAAVTILLEFFSTLGYVQGSWTMLTRRLYEAVDERIASVALWTGAHSHVVHH